MKLQQKNNPLAKKVAMYAAAGAAVTVGGVNMADAEICDSTTVITANAIGESFNVDVDNDGFLDFAISVTGTLNGIGFGSSSFFNIAGVGSNLVGVNDGAVQTYLGGNFYLSGFGSSFAGTSAASAGLMRIRYPSAGGSHYGPASQFGLQFDIGGNTHFGAATYSVDVSSNAAVITFQWEKVAGRGFGAIPEPTSLSLLAMGSLGLAARRRKK